MSYLGPAGAQEFPKGTTIKCRSHFENSRFNPYDPDPAATVRVSPQTHPEIMQGFFCYTDDTKELNLAIDSKTGQALPVPRARASQS